MAEIRLIAIDVDGTLTDRADCVRPAVREAVGEALAAGLRVVLATGRGPDSAGRTLTDLGFALPLVLANGAVLCESLDEPPVEKHLLDAEVAREAVRLHRRAGFEPVVYDDPWSTGKVVYEREFEPNRPFVERNPYRMQRVDDLLAWIDHEVLLTVTFGEEQAVRRFAEAAGAALAGRAEAQALWHPLYQRWTLDVIAPGCTKWHGTLRYAQRHGIAAEEILAIGDGLNDLEMIEGAGWGVAMGNADPEVLEVADEVVADNDHDGVAEALRRHVRRTEAA